MNAIKVRQCPFLSRCPLCARCVSSTSHLPHFASITLSCMPPHQGVSASLHRRPSCPFPPSSRLMPPPPSQVLAKVDEANQIGRVLPPDALYNQLIRWAGGGREAGSWCPQQPAAGVREDLQRCIDSGASASAPPLSPPPPPFPASVTRWTCRTTTRLGGRRTTCRPASGRGWTGPFPSAGWGGGE